MNYFYLNPKKEHILFVDEKIYRNQIIDNIIQLRSILNDPVKGIPEKKLSGNLILGTWNIRELGGRKFGGRMVESLYYIAEIISRFDLIAIQEVRDDLDDLNSILRLLGNDYGIFTSIVTVGVSGNKERLAFIYDKRTVSFRNIAGQVILPPNKEGNIQFARSPYIIRFQSGWLKFDICTTHIYFGKESKSSAEYKRRVKEIKDLVSYFNKYYIEKKEANNVFLIGDFNIENTKSETYKAATSSVFNIPDSILKSGLRGSNVKGDKIYDQILYYNKYNDITFKNAGIFDFFDTVFNSYDTYSDRIKAHFSGITSSKFSSFRTYQMSDHLPLWVEMNTDHTEDYLKKLKRSS